MKKLLTVLLTLVMAVCLINLNNSQTKAEDENVDPITANVYFSRKFRGMANEYGLWTSSSASTQIDAKYNSYFEFETNKPNIKFKSINSNKKFAINKAESGETDTDASIEFSGSNVFNISDSSSDAIQCEGFNLTIKSSGNNDDYLSITTNAYNCDGISTAAKNIIFDNANVSITTKGSGDGASIDINDNSKITVNNSTLNLKNESTDFYCFKIKPENLVLADNSSIIAISNNANNISPVQFVGDATSASFDYDILVSASADGSNPQAPVLTYDGSSYTKLYAGTNIAKYVKITPKQSPVPPTPTPSPSEPSKKDESCEKVIGPTWHWNNDKGICEDYGVVGTSTR